MSKTLPTQHPKWTKGDFELVSSDGVTFRTYSYHLQSASETTSPDYAQALRLVNFLRKFECQPATGYLSQFVKAFSKSQDVNFLRILTAMHLGLPQTCAELLDNEPALFQWLHPVTRKDTLPKQLPFEVFQHIPQRYLWALIAAGIHDESQVPVYVKSSRKSRCDSHSAMSRKLHNGEKASPVAVVPTTSSITIPPLSAGSIMSETTEPTAHEKWTEGDFELISSDNVLFKVPTYQLQAASSGSGEQRIVLDEKSGTINLFLQLVIDGATSFLSYTLGKPDYQPAVDIVYFLRKYECQAVLEQIKVLTMLPPVFFKPENIARLLIAMHLDLPEVVAMMIERNPTVFKWLLPSNSASERSEFVDYAAFKYMPRQYVWALISADISKPGIMTIVRSGNVKDVPRRERFLRFLTEAKEAG
ncbi:hypothetical protein A1Q2_00168 [Trichosporon asahii var. asahii CBS 8904]|uniref:Uncharacterized protein n=1 Tax=Trichosporon asahii var. asahii (strain CBS 8904) TaxID=1220162 RepID=K1WY12_TRIAC|nr:hypothetical protein A1Q2_00168 [Trichosporon asahii var. asahii CBS 8904]